MENTSMPSDVPSDDRVSGTTTIYQVSAGTIFWKNFLAGASRALGSLVIYFVFLAVMFYIAQRTVLPVIMPLIEGSVATMQTIQSTQKTMQGINGSTQNNAQFGISPQLLQQLEDLYGTQSPSSSAPNNRATPMY